MPGYSATTEEPLAKLVGKVPEPEQPGCGWVCSVKGLGASAARTALYYTPDAVWEGADYVNSWNPLFRQDKLKADVANRKKENVDYQIAVNQGDTYAGEKYASAVKKNAEALNKVHGNENYDLKGNIASVGETIEGYIFSFSAGLFVVAGLVLYILYRVLVKRKIF